MQVMLWMVMFWTSEGSWLFCSRSHTSMLPSARPMKSMAGRVRDQQPTMYLVSEQGDCMSGPSCGCGAFTSKYVLQQSEA